MIDGFRYGFFGVSDMAPERSLTIVATFFVLLSTLTLTLFQRGWKLRP